MYVEHERSKLEHVSRYQAYMYAKHECSKLEYERNLTVIDKAYSHLMYILYDTKL